MTSTSFEHYLISSLLQCDPASLTNVVAADSESLRRLNCFGKSLAKYTSLLLQITTCGGEIATPLANETVAITPTAAAAAAVVTQPVIYPGGTPQPQPQLQPNTTQVAVYKKEDTNTNNNATNVDINNRKAPPAATPDNHQLLQRQQVNHHPTVGEKRPRFHFEVITEDHNKEDQEEHYSPNEKEQRLALHGFGETEPKANDNIEERRPFPLAHGHFGGLNTSTLRRSAGKTRKTLNFHHRALGFSAQFGQSTISTKDNKVSHITLNSKWNILPKEETEPLELWLGEGLGRLRVASLLDPSKFSQSPTGIPVFWAAPPQTKAETGGDRCHYIGHYCCVEWERFASPVVVKKKNRQAVLVFQFVYYDETLAEQIGNLDHVEY